MTEHLFRELYKYKFGTERPDRELLKNLIHSTVSELKKNYSARGELFALHLLIEVRDIILFWESTSKGSCHKESAELRKEADELLVLLPPDIRNSSKLLIQKLLLNSLDIAGVDYGIIRYCDPWNFYLLEKKDEKRLHFISHVDGFEELTYELDRFESYRVTMEDKVWETIYSILERFRTKHFLKRAAKM